LFPAYQKRILLGQTGLINHKLNLVNNIGLDNEKALSEALDLLEAFPDPDFFNQIPKECDDQIFFKVLIMNLKKGVLSEQKKIVDKKKCKKGKVKKKVIRT
jgi:hypothetical protein